MNFQCPQNLHVLAAWVLPPCADLDGDGYGSPASVSCSPPEPGCDSTTRGIPAVKFVDPNLEACVRSALKVPKAALSARPLVVSSTIKELCYHEENLQNRCKARDAS